MLSSGRTSDRNRPEQQKYLKWWVEETKKGLLDVKLFGNPEGIAGKDTEEVFKELNEINDKLASGDFEEVEEGF